MMKSFVLHEERREREIELGVRNVAGALLNLEAGHASAADHAQLDEIASRSDVGVQFIDAHDSGDNHRSRERDLVSGRIRHRQRVGCVDSGIDRVRSSTGSDDGLRVLTVGDHSSAAVECSGQCHISVRWIRAARRECEDDRRRNDREGVCRADARATVEVGDSHGDRKRSRLGRCARQIS